MSLSTILPSPVVSLKRTSQLTNAITMVVSSGPHGSRCINLLKIRNRKDTSCRMVKTICRVPMMYDRSTTGNWQFLALNILTARQDMLHVSALVQSFCLSCAHRGVYSNQILTQLLANRAFSNHAGRHGISKRCIATETCLIRQRACGIRQRRGEASQLHTSVNRRETERERKREASYFSALTPQIGTSARLIVAPE